MIELTFTPAQMAILDRALSSRPYQEVADLIASMNAQLRAIAERQNQTELPPSADATRRKR